VIYVHHYQKYVRSVILFDKGKFRVKSNDYIFWCKDLTGRK